MQEKHTKSQAFYLLGTEDRRNVTDWGLKTEFYVHFIIEEVISISERGAEWNLSSMIHENNFKGPGLSHSPGLNVTYT